MGSMGYGRNVKRLSVQTGQFRRPNEGWQETPFASLRSPDPPTPWTADRIGRLGDRFEDLFNRLPSGWPPRDSWVEMQAAIPLCARGEVGFRLVRLPLAACVSAAVIPHGHTRAESAEHQQMKQAARVWMQWAGAADAVLESTRFGGRSDVASVSSNWIVECGHTRMGKLADAIAELPTGRFTLIPYQPLEWWHGGVRRLIAIDFSWTPTASEEVARFLSAQRQAAADSMWEKMVRNSAHLELDD